MTGQQLLRNGLFLECMRRATWPVLLAFLLTCIRFSLEYFWQVPEVYMFLIGLLWLTLGLAIYWGIKLTNHQRPIVSLLLTLTVFAVFSRVSVYIAWWVDRKFELGTHYGLFFDAWPDALFNQLFYGSLVQIFPGFLVGVLTIVFVRRLKPKN